MVVIREATLSDQAEVFDLLRQLMATATEESPVNQPGRAETFQKVIEEEQGTIFLADEDGQILGMITLSYPVAIRCGGIYSCIEEFIVTEQARGKGVGGKLLEAAIQKATEKGCRELQVNRPSEVGYPVYIRHGWKDLGKHLSLHPGE
ncbi:MAG: GNAT family N-acetyltransferase [Desulfobacterales bacterium]